MPTSEMASAFSRIYHTSKNAQNGLCLPMGVEGVLWGSEQAKLLTGWQIRAIDGKITTGEFHKDCELFKAAILAVTGVKSKVKLKPTFAMLANKRPALKNWERRKSESVIEILSKRGEIVIDETGRATAYYLGAGLEG